MIEDEKLIISSPDNTFIAFKSENSDYPSKEKYNGHSLEGGTLPLTRAPLALDFPSPTGGCSTHPRLSRLLLVVEENGKSVRKFVKNDFVTITVNFSLKSKLWPQGQKMTKFSSFFRDCQTLFRKISIISGTIIARRKPKNVIRKRIEFPIN